MQRTRRSSSLFIHTERLYFLFQQKHRINFFNCVFLQSSSGLCVPLMHPSENLAAIMGRVLMDRPGEGSFTKLLMSYSNMINVKPYLYLEACNNGHIEFFCTAYLKFLYLSAAYLLLISLPSISFRKVFESLFYSWTSIRSKVTTHAKLYETHILEVAFAVQTLLSLTVCFSLN